MLRSPSRSATVRGDFALSCTCGAPTLHRICPPARTYLDVLSAPDRYTSGTRDGGELLALEPQLRRSPVLLVKHGVRRAFQNDVLARLTRARLNEVEQGLLDAETVVGSGTMKVACSREELTQ